MSGAARMVGEKTLVRIEQVGRSAAQASLVNPPEGTSNGSADGDGDGETRRRRRGRRGGRNRRKKPAESSS